MSKKLLAFIAACAAFLIPTYADAQGNLTQPVPAIAGNGLTSSGSTINVVGATGGGLQVLANSVGLTPCSTIGHAPVWDGDSFECAPTGELDGAGTGGRSVRWTDADTLGDGAFTDDGTNATIGGTLGVTGLLTATAGLTTPANVTTTGTGALVVAGAGTIGGTFDVNSNLSKFGATDGDVYLTDTGIAVGYARDADYDLSFNFNGYAGGTTRFRNSVFYDGKNATACTLTGSTKSLNCVGGLQENGTAVLSGAIADNVIPKGASGNLVASSWTDDGTTSTTTGALEVTGYIRGAEVESLVASGAAGLVVGTASKSWTFYPVGNDLLLHEYTGTQGGGGGSTRVTFGAGGLVTIPGGGTTAADWTTTGTGDLVSADDLTVGDDAVVTGDTTLSGSLVRSGNTLNDTDSVLYLQYGLANGVQIGDGGTPSSLTVAGTASVTGALGVDGVLDVNNDLAKFGGGGDGYAYVATNQLNFMYATDADSFGIINGTGFNGSTTRFRDLYIYDGKNVEACKFTGSTKSLNCVGGLQENGTAVLSGAITANVVPKGSGGNLGDSNITSDASGNVYLSEAGGGVALWIGDLMTSTTAADVGMRITTDATSIYNDSKLGNGGTIVHRVGHNTESGGARTWLAVTGSNGNAAFGAAGSFASNLTLLSGSHLALNNAANSAGGLIDYGNLTMGNGFRFVAGSTRLGVAADGRIFAGDTADTGIDSNLDVLTIGNTGTGQSTSGVALISASHTGSATTAGGNVTLYGANIAISATESAGSNTLTNVALRLSATNSDDAIGLLVDDGRARLDGALQVDGSITDGDSDVTIADGLIIDGGTTTALAAPAGTQLQLEQNDGTANYISLRSVGTKGIFFGNASSGSDGSMTYDSVSRGLLFRTAAVNKMMLNSSGTLGVGDVSGTTDIANNVDVIQIGNSGTGQSTSGLSLIEATHTGSFTTAGGDVTVYGGNISLSNTESAGSNTLTNVALRLSVTSGDVRYGLHVDDGSVQIDEDLTAERITPDTKLHDYTRGFEVMEELLSTPSDVAESGINACGAVSEVFADDSNRPGVVSIAVASDGVTVNGITGAVFGRLVQGEGGNCYGSGWYAGGGAARVAVGYKIWSLSDPIDGTDDFVVSAGLIDEVPITDLGAHPNNGIYCRADGTNVNWKACTSEGTTSTCVATTPAIPIVEDAWMRCEFTVNAAGTQVDFTITNVTAGTSGTASRTVNIPNDISHPVGLGISIDRNGSTADGSVFVDYLWMDQTFTTAR